MAGTEQLKEQVEEVVHGHNLMLYDLEMVQQRGRVVLRVYVERDGDKAPVRGEGVTVGECEAISRELSQIFDVDEPLAHEYMLEVSSPGIERVLKTRRHFEWALGESVCLVHTPEEEGASHTVEGVLAGVSEDDVLSVRLFPKVKKLKKGQKPKLPPMEAWELKKLPMRSVRKAKTVFTASSDVAKGKR